MITIPLDNKKAIKDNINYLQLASARESTDCLQIALDGTRSGLIESINNLNGGVSGCPGNKKMLAIKQQVVRSSGHAIITLYEIYPNPGNIWINVYNQEWKGWKLVSGKMELWTGTATASSAITVAAPKSYFNSLDVFFNDGERINLPLTDGNEDMWGSLATTAGTQFYLKSVHVQFTTSNKISVISCQQKDFATNTVSNVKITKIIGRP